MLVKGDRERGVGREGKQYVSEEIRECRDRISNGRNVWVIGKGR